MKAVASPLAQEAPRGLARLGAYAELAKPRVTLLVIITAAAGVWLAPGQVTPARALLALVGVTLVVAGANALNMLLERDVDALMRRTRGRPLPSGRLKPSEVLLFGLGTSAVSLPLLAQGVNPLTGLLAAISLALYVLAYTPLKRRSTVALLVGAVPGAMPPLMGWTAVTGRLDAGGVGLFLILFVWQLPHFIAISLFRAEEYRAAGLKVLPVERGVRGAKERIALWSLVLMAVSLHVVRLGLGGPFYLACALTFGGGLVTLAFYGLYGGVGGGLSGNLPAGRELEGTGAGGATGRWARWYFLYTLVYLPALFLALLVNRG